MKRNLLIFTLLALTSTLFAQHTITGRVTNQSNGELLEMVAVRLFCDSVMVTGAQTDAKGVFTLPHIKNGNYMLNISSLGFKEKNIPVTVQDKDLNLKTIALVEDVQSLSQIEVRGTAAEMVVKGDTVEYNASAYKTAENAMAEELLKKMPGVEVDADGNVKVNGEEIKAVRIDGKKFFGNDVQMATKNIPADMIDKVQVIDDKSAMASLTGFEDDDTERIINFTLKANKKKGLFGNFKGGLGSDIVFEKYSLENLRYDASAFINLLTNDAQTTIIAGANNTNAPRSGRGRGPMMGSNSGITRTENLGVNTNISTLGGKFLIGGDAEINHSQNDTRTESEKESFTNGITYNNRNQKLQTSQAFDTRLRMELEWKIDSLNKLLFRPEISYTSSLKYAQDQYTYLKTDSSAVRDTTTTGWQSSDGLSEEIYARLRIIYNRKTLKPGRTFTLQSTVNFTNTKDGTFNKSENMQLGNWQIVNQKQEKRSNNTGYEMRFSWVEPLYKNQHFLETSLTLAGNTRLSDKEQYRFDSGSKTYSILDSLYTNSFRSQFFSETLELNYRFKKEKVDLITGVRVNPSQTISQTHYLIADTSSIRPRNVWNFAPNINFKYKLDKKQFIRIRYRGRTDQPSVSQMEPVRDNSNAMSETVGNLSLNPAFRHNLFFMFSSFKQEKMLSLMGGLRATLTKDALVYNSIYDETGKLYRQTVNANGLPYDVSGDFMVSVPVVKNRLHLNSRTALSYNERLSYLLKEQKANEIDINNLLLGDENRTGNTRLSENLSLRLSHDVVDFGVQANFTYSYTTNNMQTVTAPHVFDWGVRADFTFHLPKNWTISTDLGYNDRHGYQLEGSLSEIIWNASIDKTWGIHTLSLSCKDMLNQRKNLVQTISENTISYTRYNTLPTYFMLTYTCKLNRMGDLKAKGRAGFMQQMIEGGFDPTKGGTPPPPEF